MARTLLLVDGKARLQGTRLEGAESVQGRHHQEDLGQGGDLPKGARPHRRIVL